MTGTLMDLREKHGGIIAGVLLAAVVAALYWPVAGYDFIALDDTLYLLENPKVQQGITAGSLIWAMTTFDAANWHPLTWISLLADFELFGLHPAGYHLVNLVLHLLNTLLLFVLLRQMTGELWKGAAVAAFFAVHPLNIESVVWIAERKNLISTLLWILTLIAYVRYVRRPHWKTYLPVLGCFALGLTAKPILVALPFVLVLLDYWPLGRFSPAAPGETGGLAGRAGWRRQAARLLAEKTPLLLLSLLSVWITLQAALTGGAVRTLSAYPLAGRIENAVMAYAAYLYKMVWPADLAIFYPYPTARPLWQVVPAALFLAVVTAWVCIRGIRHRYLITGWCWFGVTLIPVIGLVQVGHQSMANRYAYLSLIGIFLIVAWGVPDLLRRFTARRALPAAALALIVAWAFTTKAALPHWRDSEAVFRQALDVTTDNPIAEIGMGNLWFGRGDWPRARSHYLESLRIRPDYAEAHNNLAMVLAIEGRADGAERHYREALRHDPSFAKAWNNLGVLLAARGKLEEAKACFLRVLEWWPQHGEAAGNLAAVLRQEQGLREGPGPDRTSGPGAAGNPGGSQKALERKGN